MMWLYYNRSFEHPCPPERVILDAVSAFTAAITKSLLKGSLRERNITLEFPAHVFKMLFDGKGSRAPHKPGRMYNRSDYVCPYFDDSTFLCYGKHSEGCKIVFPIYMHSCIRWSAISYDHEHKIRPRTFTELLTIKLVKEHCP